MDAQARPINRSATSATFADLAAEALHADIDWPTSPLSRSKARIELRYELSFIRLCKTHIRKAAAAGDTQALAAWKRHRSLHTLHTYIARERFHRPAAFTGMFK